VKYRMITNDVSDYINLLVRIAHIICFIISRKSFSKTVFFSKKWRKAAPPPPA